MTLAFFFNISFARWWLLLLAVVPVLYCVWEWLRRGHPLVMPFDHSGAKRNEGLRRLVTVASFAPTALLLLVAIIILSGPRRLAPVDNQKIMNNIELVLDVSGSMTAPFGDGTRYDGAMKAIEEFVTYRKDDAFGLTVFGNEVLHWVPLTKDVGAIRMATPFLRPEKMPQYFGGTQIGKALGQCQKKLEERPEGDRMIVLVSDGQSADLFGGRAATIAQELRNASITVYMIHVADGAAPEDVYTIASITGGKVFEAGEPGVLKEVFQRIDQMTPAKLKPVDPQHADFFWPVAVIGLVAVAMQTMAMFGLRYTPW